MRTLSGFVRIWANLKPYVLLRKKRATTAATVDFVQPDFSWLYHRRIYPAGDYLHPRYPATLEAAVQSGFAAAEKLMLDLRFE